MKAKIYCIQFNSTSFLNELNLFYESEVNNGWVNVKSKFLLRVSYLGKHINGKCSSDTNALTECMVVHYLG